MENSQSETIGNMELNYDKNHVIVAIDTGIFSLDTVYIASDLMKDKADITISMNLKGKILLQLAPKEKNKSLEELGREFNSMLIVCAAQSIKENSRIDENLDKLEQSSFENSLGISKLWSE